jgi:hypothetical protein
VYDLAGQRGDAVFELVDVVGYNRPCWTSGIAEQDNRQQG